jgi:hypothetical protein
MGNNITCAINCKYRIAATLYSRNMASFRCINVNCMPKAITLQRLELPPASGGMEESGKRKLVGQLQRDSLNTGSENSSF